MMVRLTYQSLGRPEPGHKLGLKYYLGPVCSPEERAGVDATFELVDASARPTWEWRAGPWPETLSIYSEPEPASTRRPSAKRLGGVYNEKEPRTSDCTPGLSHTVLGICCAQRWQPMEGIVWANSQDHLDLVLSLLRQLRDHWAAQLQGCLRCWHAHRAAHPDMPAGPEIDESVTVGVGSSTIAVARPRRRIRVREDLLR